MRRYNWKIGKQLFISFTLFELFAIVATVSGGIIKREVIESTTALAETTTQVIAVTDVAATEGATQGIPIANVATTDFSIIDSTPLTIARLTANDIKRQREKNLEISTTEEDSSIESTTKIESIAKLNITKLAQTEVSTSTEPITERSVTVAITDIPTTKDILNSSNNNGSDHISIQTVRTTDSIILENEEQTTPEIPKSDDNEHIFNDSDSTTQASQKKFVEFTAVGNQNQLDKSVQSTPRSNFNTQNASHHKAEEEVSTEKRNSHSTPYDQDEKETLTVADTTGGFETTTLQPSNTDHGSNILLHVSNENNNQIAVNNNSSIESTNYDIATNEIKNITTPTKPGEKRPKFMKGSNMTLPDAPEVWALAGMKNVKDTKEIDEKLGNITDEGNALPEINSTSPSKLITDWTRIVKEVELNNNSIRTSPNSIENTLETNQDNLQEPKNNLNEKREDQNQITSIGSSPLTTLVNYTTPVPNEQLAATTGNIEKATPSIEKNQVEDVESDYIKNKKVKIKDGTRNNSIKEVVSQIHFTPTTEAIVIDSTTNKTAKSNMLAKIVQSTTPDQSLTRTATISPPTIKATTDNNRNQINKDIASTTSIKIASTEISSSTQSTSTITTESDTQQSESSSMVQKVTETTSSDMDGSFTSKISISTQPNEFLLSTSSSTFSEASSTSTEPYEDISSSTYEVPSSTIIMQEKPVTFTESNTTPTEEYSKSTTVSYTSEDLSTATIKTTTAGLTIASNTIDKFAESTTSGFDQFTSETSKMSTTTFIFPPENYDTTAGVMNSTEDISTTTVFQNTPTTFTQHFVEPTQSQVIPKVANITTEQPLPLTTSEETPIGGIMQPDNNNMTNDTDYNVIIAISVSVVGIIALILLVGFLYVMRKRQKNLTYGQRCRPVSLDAYSLDNVSIYNSVRRKGALRASKKSYGNVAFDDPSLKPNVLNVQDLSKFVERKSTIYEEFRDVPQITARPDEVPQGCEDKNRYANVIPLPETRVVLQKLTDNENSEYINANYVRGPKDPPNYYIACQAPLESTVADFWRMIWEQNSRVIIMATDLVENGKEKCAEYLPPSITIDNHVVYGDFQITLKNREVKDKYAVSTLHIKNTSTNSWREITHFWYQWPETGVPSDEAGVIAMLLEARSCLKVSTQEQADDEETKTNGNLPEANGNVDKSKSLTKTQGPLTVHCSPGTGRTGTIIACDIALRSLETPKRCVDIPQIVYYVRRGRASAVQTKEQYEFIYRVTHMYATKISGPLNEA